MKQFKITRLNNGKKRKMRDFITPEIPLRIEINKKDKRLLLCSPNNLKDLVYGFLYSSGLIKNISQIKKITLVRRKRFAQTKISPLYLNRNGASKINTNLKVKAKDITRLINRFQNISSEFRCTGGVHSAGLASGGKVLIFRDDLGRHNAVDKVIGNCLSRNIDFSDKIMLTSGRVSSEILLKVLKCRVPILVSVSAPTDQAIRLAKRYNLTLIGFVHDKRMNIYSAEKRIIYGK